MSVLSWAEREIKTACKRENPNWDGESFDYGCSCYQSALKAFKSIMDDNHSGYSYSITKNILIKLLNNIPLSPITDDDFFDVKRGTDEFPAESNEWLKSCNLKSDLQCPRRSSLFRKEDLNGNVTYHDNDRVYCIDAECPSNTFCSGISNFIDKLYPIKMPYMPSNKPFKVYVKTWLTDKSHGDYDVHEIIGHEDPDGNWHDYNLFEYYGDNNKTEIIIDQDHKVELLNMRIDTLEKNIAARIYNDIVDNITGDLWQTNNSEYERIKKIISQIIDDNKFKELQNYCKLLTKTDEHGLCYLNTWHNQHIISKGLIEDNLYNEHPELIEFAKFIDQITNECKMSI